MKTPTGKIEVTETIFTDIIRAYTKVEIQARNVEANRFDPLMHDDLIQAVNMLRGVTAKLTLGA